jgi:hypothetical protein
MEKFLLDIGPEFFQNLGNPVGGALFQQLVCVIQRIAAIGMIQIRNRHACRVATPFRKVKPLAARIGAGHETARKGVPGAVFYAAFRSRFA